MRITTYLEVEIYETTNKLSGFYKITIYISPNIKQQPKQILTKCSY